MTTPFARFPKTTLALLLALGVCLGLAGYTFWYAQGASYLSNDPLACVNCHIMRTEYDGWQKGPHHAAATCNDCHAPHSFIPKMASKMRNGWNHSRAFTLQDFPEPIRITPHNSAILQENCLRCHDRMVSEIDPRHGPDELDCMHCHRSVGHGR
ncbi:MAG: cytochrome c nitrite reductase small subunit [Kiritimatiellia bacterium]